MFTMCPFPGMSRLHFVPLNMTYGKQRTTVYNWSSRIQSTKPTKTGFACAVARLVGNACGRNTAVSHCRTACKNSQAFGGKSTDNVCFARFGGVKSPTAAVTLAKYSASRILSSFDEARLVLYGVVFPSTCADWKKIKNFAQNAVKNA